MSAPPPRSIDEIVATLVADTSPYLSCDECADQICPYVERVAADPGYRDQAMDRHLRACPGCADEVASMLELISAEATGTPNRAL